MVKSLSTLLGLSLLLSIPALKAEPFHHHHHESLSKSELLDLLKAQQCKIEQLEEGREWHDFKIAFKYGSLSGATCLIIGYVLGKMK